MEIEFLAREGDGVAVEVGEVCGGLEFDFALHLVLCEAVVWLD